MYINRVTGERVEAEFNKAAELWRVYNYATGKIIGLFNDEDTLAPNSFQSQYGQAMICPLYKTCELNGCQYRKPFARVSGFPEWRPKDDCPPFVPYIHEEKEYDVDKEPLFPVCGDCKKESDPDEGLELKPNCKEKTDSSLTEWDKAQHKLATWLSIDDGKTCLHADEYMEKALELQDYLTVIGYVLTRED
jgi:hypothetical protein